MKLNQNKLFQSSKRRIFANDFIIFCRLLLKLPPRFAIRYLFNHFRILFHKSLYGFYLCRKRFLLPLHRRRMRISLLNAESEFAAKYGCDWRLRVFDDEVVKFLKMREYVHGVLGLKD